MRTINRTTLSYLLLFPFLLFAVQLLPLSANAQSFDHEKYPKLDFTFESLDLQLVVQPDSQRIEGAAAYNLTANISGADSVILNATRMEIEAVSLNEEEADYHLSNDSLIVTLPDSSETGESYDLHIKYNSIPRFGLLNNVHGTVWTSLLPASQRHWLPTVDNPHVTFTSTMDITVPSGYTVWATGRKTNQEITSVDNIRYTFTSDDKVPASGLSFAAGNFNNNSTSFGIKRINVAVEQGYEDEDIGQEILQDAYDFLKRAEEELGLEYPFGRLNIIILDDHHWETKSWGASTVFLYKNRGGWKAQLYRGIAAQWFGVYQREEQWSEGDAISLYQALAVDRMSEEDIPEITNKDTPSLDSSTVYDVFGPQRWQYWRQGLDTWSNQNMKTIIVNSMESVLSETGRVINWSDYADHWYIRSGQPLFDVPDFSTEHEGDESVDDSVAYKVTYNLDEADGRLILGFEALHGMYKELTSLRTIEVYSDRTDTAEITFTGERDSLVVNVDPAINTFRIDTTEYPDLHLDQYKPASFLIYELRNADTVAERAEAARKLGHHSDNPDLQLAIKDFMNRDLEPEVQAALLRSMAQITRGASGTEQVFVDALKSENQNIREAALTALQNYPQNENIIRSVENATHNAEDMKFFQKANKTLTAIVDSERYRSFVSQMVKSDTAGFRAIYATRELANMGETDIAVKQAALYLDSDFDYGVREAAMEILIQNDHTPADWLSRADDLLRDKDPRIRYLLVQGLNNVQDDEVREMIEVWIHDEYDARVHRAMQKMFE